MCGWRNKSCKWVATVKKRILLQQSFLFDCEVSLFHGFPILDLFWSRCSIFPHGAYRQHSRSGIMLELHLIMLQSQAIISRCGIKWQLLDLPDMWNVCLLVGFLLVKGPKFYPLGRSRSRAFLDFHRHLPRSGLSEGDDLKPSTVAWISCFLGGVGVVSQQSFDERAMFVISKKWHLIAHVSFERLSSGTSLKTNKKTLKPYIFGRWFEISFYKTD